MNKVLDNISFGFIFAMLVVYIYIRGGEKRIDQRKLEKIKKDIQNKPIGMVVSQLNEWLS